LAYISEVRPILSIASLQNMGTNENPQPVGSTENKVQPSQKKLQIAEAILLALASACTYLLAFYYERGYSNYFGLPTQFINVSLINLLIFGAVTLSFLTTIAIVVNAVLPFIRPKHPYLAFYIPRFIFVLFVIVILPVSILGIGKVWIWVTALILWTFMAFIYLIMPLIIHRKKGKWKDRYTAEIEREQGEVSNLYTLFASRYGNNSL
jgi:hypothetical protein